MAVPQHGTRDRLRIAACAAVLVLVLGVRPRPRRKTARCSPSTRRRYNRSSIDWRTN